jgi:hypothetical protein
VAGKVLFGGCGWNGIFCRKPRTIGLRAGELYPWKPFEEEALGHLEEKGRKPRKYITHEAEGCGGL